MTRDMIAHGTELLKKWLQKLNISNVTELSAQERQTYEQWESVLAKELKLDDLRAFLAKQTVTLSRELREAVKNGENRRALTITARLENYEAIVAFIDEPNRSREALIGQLTNLIASEK